MTAHGKEGGGIQSRGMKSWHVFYVFLSHYIRFFCGRRGLTVWCGRISGILILHLQSLKEHPSRDRASHCSLFPASTEFVHLAATQQFLEHSNIATFFCRQKTLLFSFANLVDLSLLHTHTLCVLLSFSHKNALELAQCQEVTNLFPSLFLLLHPRQAPSYGTEGQGGVYCFSHKRPGQVIDLGYDRTDNMQPLRCLC